MVKYEFVYFDAQARGEPARLAFAAAGVDFKDNRVKYDEWEKAKSAAPLECLPYLVIDGKIKVSQSLAILRYIGRENGMAGKDSMETLFVDELVETGADLQAEWEKSLNQPTPEEMEKSTKKFKSETVPKYFRLLESLVKAHGQNGFAIGNKITIADCMLYNVVQMGGTETLGQYPCLQANRKTVESNANIAKWLSSRPKAMY